MLVQPAAADEGVLASVGNIRILYTASEPRPKQYQIYLKTEQSNSDRSCALFIAHIQTMTGKVQQSGELEAVASFLVEPNDFPVSVWLTDLRVESWATWESQNAAQGRPAASYGNPCLEAKKTLSIPVKSIDLPRNPGIPCDSVSTDVIGVRAVQHIAIDGKSLRMELTEPDSLAVYTLNLGDIGPSSIQVQGRVLTITSNSAAVDSIDRKGTHASGRVPYLHIVCTTDNDVAAIQYLLLGK
jgi:hypothetical protein